MVTAPEKPKPDYGFGPAAQILYERVGWEPTGPEQAEVVKCRKQAIGVSGGIGSGKSNGCAGHWLGRYPEDLNRCSPDGKAKGDGVGEPLLYWLVGAAYSETSEEFKYILNHLYEIFPQSVVQAKHSPTPEISVKFPDERNPRLVIETRSGQDPSRISRQRPDGTMICEAGQLDISIFENIWARVITGGGWLFMSGTLEASIGWYPQILQAWASGAGNTQSFKLPTWTNRFLYPGGRYDPKILEIERTSTDDYFTMRLAGEIVPPKGLVIPEFRADLHVRQVDFDTSEPVFVFSDPGYSAKSAYAILAVQRIDRQLRIIDEIYERGLVTEQIILAAQKREWWQNVSQVVVDPFYGDQHHAVHSVNDVWIKETGITPCGERLKVPQGIEVLRTHFKIDPITGHTGIVISPHCHGILSELGAALDPFDNRSFHPWKWKEDRYGNPIGNEPMDEYNHSCMALMFGIVWNYGYSNVPDRKVAKVVYR